LYDTLQPTPPLVDTVINEPLRQSAPLHNRLLQLFHVLMFNSDILIIVLLLPCFETFEQKTLIGPA